MGDDQIDKLRGQDTVVFSKHPKQKWGGQTFNCRRGQEKSVLVGLFITPTLDTTWGLEKRGWAGL